MYGNLLKILAKKGLSFSTKQTKKVCNNVKNIIIETRDEEIEKTLKSIQNLLAIYVIIYPKSNIIKNIKESNFNKIDEELNEKLDVNIIEKYHSNLLFLEKIKLKSEAKNNLNYNEDSSFDILKIIKSFLFGSLMSSGLFNFVVTFGTASTGTAISTLSGVAATNAALAKIGFGTLAAGGLGIVGGKTILISLTLLPVFYTLNKKESGISKIKLFKLLSLLDKIRIKLIYIIIGFFEYNINFTNYEKEKILKELKKL